MNEQIIGTKISQPLPQWTQNEAIAYECACECITDLQSIIMATIYEEEVRNTHNDRLTKLKAAASKLWQQRSRLHVHSHDEIARIRSEYGGRIREWRESANKKGGKDERLKAMLSLIAEHND